MSEGLCLQLASGIPTDQVGLPPGAGPGAISSTQTTEQWGPAATGEEGWGTRGPRSTRPTCSSGQPSTSLRKAQF